MATGYQWDQKNEGKLAQPLFEKLPNCKMLVLNGFDKPNNYSWKASNQIPLILAQLCPE